MASKMVAATQDLLLLSYLEYISLPKGNNITSACSITGTPHRYIIGNKINLNRQIQIQTLPTELLRNFELRV